MIALLLAAVVLLILLLPLRLRAWYDSRGLGMILSLWRICLWQYPAGKKTSGRKQKKERTKAGATGRQPGKKGGDASEFFSLVKMLLEFLGRLRRKLRIRYLTLHLIVAQEDPCDLGIRYGATCGAFAALETQLDRLFVIRKKEYRIDCDFLGDKSTILADTQLQIPLITLITLVIPYGIRLLGKLMKSTNDKKGGARI